MPSILSQMTISQLIYNFAILIALSVISGVIEQFAPRNRLNGKIFQGILFGSIALINISYPFKLADGLIFDGRSIVISLATLFFGPVTGIISTIPAAIYRWHIGGPGVYMGTGVIVSSFLIGWAGYYLRRVKHLQNLRYRHLLFFGFMVPIAALVLHFFISMFVSTPTTPIQRDLIVKMGLFFLGINPLVTFVLGVLLNDQEQNRKLLEELTINEQFLSKIFRSIGDSLIILNKQGRIVDMNEAAERLFGVESKNIKDQSIDTLTGFSNLPISGSQLHQSNQDYIIVPPFEIKVSNKKVLVAGNIALIKDENGLNNGWIVLLRDLSREMETQQRIQDFDESYTSLFNSILSSVYYLDENGTFLDVNKAAEKTYGYPKDRFIGNTPEFLSAPGLNDFGTVMRNIKMAFGGSAVQFEFWGLRASGQTFPKDVFLFPTSYLGQKAIVAIGHDISERKEAERNIRMSEARYKSLFEASPLGIILVDLSGTILSANATFCREYGYEPIEIIGKNISFLSSPENQSKIRQNIDQIIREGQLNSRIKAKTKHGEEIDIELSERLIDLPDGRKGILSISKNITNEVKAEAARRLSEQKVLAIIQSIPDMIFVLNSDGVFTEYFASNTDDLLIATDAFINRPVTEVIPPFLSTLVLEGLQRVLSTHQVTEFEYELLIRNKLQHFEARMVPLNEQHVLVLVRNITEKRNHEKALEQQNIFIETLLDSIPNPLFYMDKRSVYLGVNKAFADYYGIEKEAIVGKTMFEWDNLAIAMQNHEADKLIFEGREKTQLLERSLAFPNGSVREVLISKSAFHTPDGEMAGLIGLIIDITDRKRNELELIRAKEKAEESDRLKTSFLNNLNHEIRTPLNAILGFADLLFDDTSYDQKREYVQIINSNAEQLLRIIDDVLIVSRMDSERITVDNINFGIHQLLHDLKQTFNNACLDKNLRFESDYYNQDDVEIRTDRAKLRQLLSILLDNAVKYTMKGSIRLSYNIEGNDIRIHVHDTGMGIPKSEQQQIFARFFRGQQPQQMAIRGNGLGLSIAAGLVRLLNGSIEVQSETNVGTTFTLLLPGVVEKKLPNNPQQPQTIATPTGLKQHNFLIAENEDDNYEYLRTLLLSQARVIERAHNGAEAVELLDRKAFDLVLMDIKMPIMDGYEATKIMREKYPRLPIVVQTAYSQPDEMRMIMEAGATDVLIKPINKEVFYQVIQRLLG